MIGKADFKKYYSFNFILFNDTLWNNTMHLWKTVKDKSCFTCVNQKMMKLKYQSGDLR